MLQQKNALPERNLQEDQPFQPDMSFFGYLPFPLTPSTYKIFKFHLYSFQSLSFFHKFLTVFLHTFLVETR